MTFRHQVTKSLELAKPGATSPCFSIGHIDGRPLQMAVTVPLSRALSFGTVSLTSCHGTALDLAAGRHEITTLPGVIIDQIVLASSGDMRPIAVAPAVHVTSMSDTRVTFSLGRATQPYYIVAGQAYSSGWHATLDGRELGPPVPLDGYTFGWRVNELGPHRSGSCLWTSAGNECRTRPVRHCPSCSSGSPSLAASATAKTASCSPGACMTPTLPGRRIRVSAVLKLLVFAAALFAFDGPVGATVALAIGIALAFGQPPRRLILAGAAFLASVPVVVIIRGLPSPGDCVAALRARQQRRKSPYVRRSRHDGDWAGDRRSSAAKPDAEQ